MLLLRNAVLTLSRAHASQLDFCDSEILRHFVVHPPPRTTMPHIELLANQASAPAPGWAYVPESNYIDPSKTAINPTGARARHKNAAGGAQGHSELTARQQTAVQRRLQELDRDAPARDVTIPRDKAGGVGKTQGTRRILGSAKTWRNWLDDEEAMLGGQVQGVKGAAAAAAAAPAVAAVPADAEDVQMADNPPETDPLLRVDTLASVSPRQIEALLSVPPLSYNAARAAPPDDTAPPPRHFCEICGYWGRVRCLKCGSRICGLDCKTVHDAECSRRFA